MKGRAWHRVRASDNIRNPWSKFYKEDYNSDRIFTINSMLSDDNFQSFFLLDEKDREWLDERLGK